MSAGSFWPRARAGALYRPALPDGHCGRMTNSATARFRERGQGTVEYVGIIVTVTVLVLGVVVAVASTGVGASLGRTIVCAIESAFASVTGSAAPTCELARQTAGDEPAPPVTVVSVPEDGNSTSVINVNAPPGTSWTVSADDPYAKPYVSSGTGTGDAKVFFPANPGGSRTTEVRITFSNGTQQTVTLTQPGGTQTMAVAGDSYVAGPGALADRDQPTYSYDNSPDAEKCFRSADAYPRLLTGGQVKDGAGDPLKLTMTGSGFAACTGATSYGGNGQSNDTSSVKHQLDQLEERGELADADVMILSVGGNDIGFADIVTACVTDPDLFTFGSTQCADAIQGGMDKINGGLLAGNLDDMYRTALDKTQAAGTTIYVVGYPPVVADGDPTDTVGFVPHDEEVGASAALITSLNEQIQARIDAINAEQVAKGLPPRLVYVPTDSPGGPFGGHGITTDDSYYVHVLESVFTAPPPNFTVAAYHPNDEGTKKQAEIVGGVMVGGR